MIVLMFYGSRELQNFDAKTGDVVAGPPPRALPKLDVFFKGDDIYVKAAIEEEKLG